MSDIHKPSGEQSMVVFHYQPKYKYQITAKYDSFASSIIYYSTKTAHELMQWFLSDIRHGKPCFVCDADNKYGILNLGKANVIEIDILEE